MLIALQEALARKRQRQEQEAYRLAMAESASWAARLNLSFADYAHVGAVVCLCIPWVCPERCGESHDLASLCCTTSLAEWLLQKVPYIRWFAGYHG